VPSDRRPVTVIPKGLRSFDASDADFFLELLPGPRDRDGLPESLRFWTSRIEESDPDKTFPIGLLYGPSGCGKSSQVKAGLLPRLGGGVTAIYIEATGQDTEARLLKGLRRHCPDLAPDGGLVATVAALRRGHGLPAGKKVLIVLDQFEQWLHARHGEENTELVQALRQCDGERVQCLVLVRDDFWMAATRFFEELEVSLLQGKNSAAVDLFDLRHARKVLAAFGRAYGALPAEPARLTPDQESFLDRAVAGVAEDGRLISVRLALLAEMVKGRPWTAATLKEVGGAKGIGSTFLAETFTARTAQPRHRLHQQAARAVLDALLPETGSELKGKMRSYRELLEASGYASRPRAFADLLHILDSELRLLTPAEPAVAPSGSTPDPGGEQRFYQLTHDYLVPALRDWLTRKQKETWRGRAELLLAERAVLWTARPETRQLPGVGEWARIGLLTRHRWAPTERKMMQVAARYHALRGAVVLAVLLALTWGGLEGHGRLRAQMLRDELLNAPPAKVPQLIARMTPYRRWLDPLLRDYLQGHASRPEVPAAPLPPEQVTPLGKAMEAVPAPKDAMSGAPRPAAGAPPEVAAQPGEPKDEEPADDSEYHRELNVRMALLPTNEGHVEELYRALFDTDAEYFYYVRGSLRPYRQVLRDRLWKVAEAKGQPAERRFRAACALSLYDPESPNWPKVVRDVTEALASKKDEESLHWRKRLLPIRQKVIQQLSALLSPKVPHQPRLPGERERLGKLLEYYRSWDVVAQAQASEFGVGASELSGTPNFKGD
jgi:hypothetical protein